MKYFGIPHLFAVLLLAAQSPLWAQPGGARAPGRLGQEQRAELRRDVAEEQRKKVDEEPRKVDEEGSVQRRLTPQQRAELRRQLRDQDVDGPDMPSRPARRLRLP